MACVFCSDVKVHKVLNCGDGLFVHIERDEGIVIDAPAWIVDAAFCRMLDLGAARASLEALFDLSSLSGSWDFGETLKVTNHLWRP